MQLRKLATLAITAITALVTIQSVQAAVLTTTDPNYFVRPALRIGAGELIDGISVNNDINSMQEQGVVGYSSSEVDLAQGTVKMYAAENSFLEGLQTFGSFGERITVTGGAGTDWDLSFAVEGILDVFGGAPIVNGQPPATLLYNVGIAVYRPGQVQWNNFVNNPNFEPLLFEFNEVVDIVDGFDEFSRLEVFADVFGSIQLESDYEVFDIFAFTNVVVTPNLGSGFIEYEADFLNTARFGQTFAAGVEAFSSSGQFMGLGNPPPPPINNVSNPSAFALFSMALSVILLRSSARKIR